jgi:hypothetical protein
MNKKLTVAQAKRSLGKGKGTGKKGWFGSKARTSVVLKLKGPKDGSAGGVRTRWSNAG